MFGALKTDFKLCYFLFLFFKSFYLQGYTAEVSWGRGSMHATYSIDPLSTLRLSGKLMKLFHLSAVLLPCAVLLFRGALVLSEK